MRAIKYFSVFLLILLLAGCTTVKKDPYFLSNVGFSPENQKLWTRPAEISYKFEKDIVGTAEATYVFGIPVEGEAPMIDVMGVASSTKPLVKIAALNAISKNGVDGIYIIHSTIRKTGFWPIYFKKEAFVQGKALILKVIGQVDQKRFDKERALVIENQGIKRLKGLFSISK